MKITLVQLNDLRKKYYKEAWFRNQKFGQFICNETGITDNNIFYEEDSSKAYQMIIKNHLENYNEQI
jgi:hypothetical protein